MSEKTQKIGLLTATSLVVGNMIGVGIFVLPAVLSNYGSISLLGWLFTATGALILAKIFSNFSKIIVSKSGGPYVYSKAGFGDFIGFQVGGNSTIEKIRNLSGTTQSGTSMLGLYQAANKCGIDATGYEASIDDIKGHENVFVGLIYERLVEQGRYWQRGAGDTFRRR